MSLVWRTSLLTGSDTYDVQCPGRDEFPKDPGCQVRCRDDNCTSAWRVLHELQRSRDPATHVSINCCPPYGGCSATLKGGVDPLAGLEGDLCERRCAAKLSSSYYDLELSKHTMLCDRMASSSSDGSRRTSTLSLVANYMHATNVAINFRKGRCPDDYKGRNRIFDRGFMIANCQFAPAAPNVGRRALRKARKSHSRRGGRDAETDADTSAAQMTTAAQGSLVPSHLEMLEPIVKSVEPAVLPMDCEEERRFTVFVSRKDMGNYAHHLGDMLAVFQLFHALKLKPHDAQLVLLDVRLMCWGERCELDCPGPFTKLWPAITGGARVVRAADYSSRPVCFKEAAFATHWSEIAKHAWAKPRTQCTGSSVLRAFRLRVMEHMGVLNNFPPSGKMQLLYTRRGSFLAMGKKQVHRQILNEDELLEEMRAAYQDFELVPVDFGKLSLAEQMTQARRARLLFGMHGAGFMNLMWLPREAVVVEMFPYKALLTPVHANLAKFCAVQYLTWSNPHAEHHKEPGAHTRVVWPSLKPTLDAAVYMARQYGRVFASSHDLDSTASGRVAPAPVLASPAGKATMKAAGKLGGKGRREGAAGKRGGARSKEKKEKSSWWG